MALADGGDLVVARSRKPSTWETPELQLLNNYVITNSVFTKRNPRFEQRTARFTQKEAPSWPW